MLDVEARDEAVERLARDRGYDIGRAHSEIKRRIKDIKCVIALWGYVNWAREHKILVEGPALNSVNYTRMQEVLERKCYGADDSILKISIWDLVDLSNERVFARYSERLVVPFSLQEILLMNRREWDTVKSSRSYLVAKRKQNHETHA